MSYWKSVRTSKNVFYENPYCVKGAVKPTGSEQTPKDKCKDRIIETRKGAELKNQYADEENKPLNLR